MTPINLMFALRSRIEEITKGYKFQESDGDHALRKINIHLQHLPEKLYDNEVDPADYPFILLILGGGPVDESSDGFCDIAILVGGYDDGIEIEGDVRDRQGWMIPTEIIWRIISDFKLNPIIDKRYKLQLPLDWDIPEEQPAPIWIGTIRARFSVPVIPQEFGMDWWETNPTMETYKEVPTL